MKEALPQLLVPITAKQKWGYTKRHFLNHVYIYISIFFEAENISLILSKEVTSKYPCSGKESSPRGKTNPTILSLLPS